MAITPEHAEMLRNAYDNSIYYTDYFLARTINVSARTGRCLGGYALLLRSWRGHPRRSPQALPARVATTTAYQLHVAALSWFSDTYRRNFPAKVAAAEENTSAPATTHSLFHTMADMASIEGRYVDYAVSLVNTDFDYARPRRYLNDHNEAVSFARTGLSDEDYKIFADCGIEFII